MNEISRKILCVDDDALLLEGLKRNLRKKFDLTFASGGEEGLTVLREHGPFAVVVSDYRMPGMNGVEFLRATRALSPETVLVMLTGEAELSVAVSALHEGHIFRFLNKPCPPQLLEITLRDSIEQHRLTVNERLLREELDQANEELRLLNDGLERQVERRTEMIEGLYRLVSDLNGLDSLDEVAQCVVSRTADLLHSRRVALLLPDPAGGFLSVKAATGLDGLPFEQVRIVVGKPLAGVVYQQSLSVVLNEAGDLQEYPGALEPEWMLAVPVVYAAVVAPEGPVGVLMVGSPGSGRYEIERLATLKAVAEASAIALLNQVHREERDGARDATILALAKLAEHRDPDTGAHLERVQCYCRLLSEAMAATSKYAGVITRSFVHNIVRSSPLHDVGKVGIPDHILLKPGRLSPEEFEVMKRHAAIGGDTIRALVEQGRRQSFLDMGMKIAYHHHERYDGAGYPDGLAGEAIPLSARIMALADVYDALTSRRIYKPVMPHEHAFELITSESGAHFDPDVVAAFVGRQDAFRRLAAALAEPADGPRCAGMEIDAPVSV